ncbi:hypothetical protein IG631_14794 [Alternaria alternata]|nr:hypothetical protein IG631_14794 [Alternaria alternata]
MTGRSRRRGYCGGNGEVRLDKSNNSGSHNAVEETGLAKRTLCWKDLCLDGQCGRCST